MIQPGEPSALKGQSGSVRTALFASDAAVPRLVLYPVVLMLTLGLIFAALKLDDWLRPPLWVHALIWPPVVGTVMVGALRLVHHAHRRRADGGTV